jgi:hypothetical protein
VGRAHKLAAPVILVGGITRVAILAAALEWAAARLRALVAEGGEMDAAFRAGRMFQVGRDE